MFVVAPAIRQTPDPDKPAEFTLAWPIVFEDTTSAINSGVIATRESRGLAAELADALNAAIRISARQPSPSSSTAPPA